MKYCSYEYLDKNSLVFLLRIHDIDGPSNDHQLREYSWSCTCVKSNDTDVRIVGVHKAPVWSESKAVCSMLAKLGFNDLYWERSSGKVSHISLKRFK